MQDKEKLIASHMKNLDCTREEAIDIIESDYKIDHNERVYFDLSKEQEKQAKKFGNVPRGRTVYKFDKNKKTVKENPTKEQLIADLFEFLTEKVENAEITNKNRQISFSFNGENFDLTLVQKRKKKS